jgi:large subunit ribosomal protein L25
MSPQQHKIELNAEPRTIMGRKVKALRQTGHIPAVLYGKGQEPLSLQVPAKSFSKTLKKAGESTLVYLNVDGQAYPTIIHDVARDAGTDEIIHADFYKVNLSEKIKTKVPVVFIGESPAVVEKKGIFVRNVNELEVEALPQDLPHEISIDISKLADFSDQILLKDIDLGPKVEIQGNPDDIIALVQEPLSEEQLKAMMEGDQKTVEEVEVIKPEKPEGEEAVEGGETAPVAEPEAEAKKE